MQTFIMGEMYELIFTIAGRMIPVQAAFTGQGVTVNGVEFGRFERTDNSGALKTYLISKEGYHDMQQHPWADEKAEW